MATESAILASAFEERLGEAIAWCAARAVQGDPAGSLRSAALRPAAIEDHGSRSANYEWLEKLEPSGIARVVGELCSRRSEALRQETAPLTSPAHDLQGGRLLLFAPQATVWDGASASVSKGFFDVADAPPWDTWVWVVTGEEGTAFYSPYLIAWVPPIFLELADAGIRVSPVNNVAWAKDVETATVRQLRVLGIT